MENDYPRNFYAKKSDPMKYITVLLVYFVVLGILLMYLVILSLVGFYSLEELQPVWMGTLLYVLLLPALVKWAYKGLTQQRKPLVSVFREGVRIHYKMSCNLIIANVCFVVVFVLTRLGCRFAFFLAIPILYWLMFRNNYRKTDILWEEITAITLREADGLKITVQKGEKAMKFTFSPPAPISQENTFDVPPENVAVALLHYLRDHASLPSWEKEPTI